MLGKERQKKEEKKQLLEAQGKKVQLLKTQRKEI